MRSLPRIKISANKKRLLVPGWAGEPELDEMEFIQDRLARDRRLAVKWGFDPATTTRPDWAICQVAMWGDPNQRSLNTALARQRLAAGLQLPLLAGP